LEDAVGSLQVEPVMVWVPGGVPDTMTDPQRVERGVPGPVTQIARLITGHSLCAGMATRAARSGREALEARLGPQAPCSRW